MISHSDGGIFIGFGGALMCWTPYALIRRQMFSIVKKNSRDFFAITTGPTPRENRHRPTPLSAAGQTNAAKTPTPHERKDPENGRLALAK